MERKLATIQLIAEIKPIEGADLIEAVRVNGWWSVSKKADFKVGAFCVFFEVDSVLPEEPAFEFLRKSCYVCNDWIRGFRLKSMRLRGQLSQGLAMPLLKLFPEDNQFPVDTDVTEMLGVKKWDPPIPACIAGEIKGHFPSFLRKTDQERIQNCYELLKPHRSESFEATLKLDGTSCTVYNYGDESGVCQRNFELKINEANKDNSLVQIAIPIIEQLKKQSLDVAIQGELLGPGIQGNRERLKSPQLFVFDVFDIKAQKYMLPEQRRIFIERLELQHVPLLEAESFPLKLDLKTILENSDIQSLNHSVAEGIVYKCNSPKGLSFKALNNKFLLNEN